MKQLLLAICCLLTPLLAQAATRVALVSTCGGDAGADVLALTEANLSQQSDIVLVERREVDRVLQEQNLATCGLSQAQQAVIVGKLLGVEVFAALEIFPGEKEALGLVVFDASNGVRVADVTLPPGDAPKTAQSVGATVVAACAKRQAGVKGLQTICLLSVRNADLPRELDSVCNAAGRLLERGIIASKAVTLLERQRLEQVNRERTLPTIGQATGLWASLTVMELEFDRTSDGQSVRATLWLTDAAGRKLGTVSVERPRLDAGELSTGLLPELLKLLHVSPVVPEMNRGREAARFSQEAQFLMDHGDIAGATQGIEAACALEPDNQPFRQTLGLYLRIAAHNVLQSGLGTDLVSDLRPLKVATADLKRSLSLYRRARQIGPGNDQWSYIRRLQFVQEGHDAETRRQLTAMQEDMRTELLQTAAGFWHRTDEVDFVKYTRWLSDSCLPQLEYVSQNAQTWTADVVQLFARWLKFSEKHPTVCNNAFNLLVFPAANIAVMAQRVESPQSEWALTNADYNHWRDLCLQMAGHPDDLVQMLGRIGQLTIDLRAGKLSSNAAVQQVQDIVNLAKQKINGVSPGISDSRRSVYYFVALAALDILPAKCLSWEDRWRAHSDLLNFMLARREIAKAVIARTTSETVWWRVGYKGYPVTIPVRLSEVLIPEAVRNADAVLTLLESPDCHWLEKSNDTLRDDLLRWRNQAIVRHPGKVPLPAAPWAEAQTVFGMSRHVLGRIADVTLHGNSVYLVVLKIGTISLVKIDLPDGKPVMLGKAAYDLDAGIVRGTVLDDGKLYVGTGQGIFIFPIAGGDGTRLSTVDGLPSDSVQSLACFNEKLYVGLGVHEGYLIAYNLKTRICDVLASSRRPEKRSPLDGRSPPFSVLAIRLDPERRRLLLYLNGTTDSAGKSLSGLWQITGNQSRLDQILELPGITWISAVHDQRLLMEQGHPWEIVEVDLRDNHVELLYQERQRKNWAPYLFLDSWLWVGWPFKRVSRDGNTQAFCPPLPNETDPLVWEGVLCLEPVDHGHRVLVGKTSGVWLLTMPEKSAKETP